MNKFKTIPQFKVNMTEVRGDLYYVIEFRAIGLFNRENVQAVTHQGGIILRYENKYLYKLEEMPRKMMLKLVKDEGFFVNEIAKTGNMFYPVHLKNVQKIGV